MMILGIIIGIIGIIFSSEIDGFMRHDKIAHPDLVEQYVRPLSMSISLISFIRFSTTMRNSCWE